MNRWCVAPLVLAFALATSARGQSFPFNDAFASYPAGSTGAPAWSILGGAFNAVDGVLRAPIVLRYNGRPPARYTVEATVRIPEGSVDESGLLGSAGFVFDMQHDADTGSSDSAGLAFRQGASGVQAAVECAAEMPAQTRRMTVDVADPGREGIPIRLVVDAENGRYAVFVAHNAVVRSAAAEYPAGLLAIRLQGAATLDDLVLRVPTDEESDAVRTTTLFNDPRDITNGDDDGIMVLHRSSPAVLVVTPDGEVTRRFGRRLPGSVPDAVALARGERGEVLVLNRFPAEVVAYDRNGGLRYRFGAGILKEPSDIAVRTGGAVYVADPVAAKVFVFGADGRYLGGISNFGDKSGKPVRVSVDALDNLVVSLDAGARTVVLRPATDNVTTALVREEPHGPEDVVVGPDHQTLAFSNNRVAVWPEVSEGATAFTGAAVGGLDADGRLARAGSHVVLLDRAKSRVVFIPDDLQDVTPTVIMQNIGNTAAIVRWTSPSGANESHVRLLRGSTWDVVNAPHKAADTSRQVLLERLTPGTTYRYDISPTVTTIPPSDWSTDFTFTAGAAGPKPSGGKQP